MSRNFMRPFVAIMVSSLIGCASAPKIQINDSEFADKLSSGDLIPASMCAWSWGVNKLEVLDKLNKERWHELAYDVYSIGCIQDLPFYLLGRAAEGLGYDDAAKKYYTKSIEYAKIDTNPYSCDAMFEINCWGFHFPRDSEVRLPGVNEKIKLANFQREPQIRRASGEGKPAADQNKYYKDDLPRLLEDWPQMAQDSHKYLFSISIDDYDEAPSVTFAERSGKLFVKTMQRFGVPEENTTALSGSEATGTRIVSRLNRMLHQIGSEDTLYFYYAGHGLPSRANNHTYLLPVDGDMGSYEDTALAMENLYRRMSQSKAKHIIAFIDACFSGRADRDTMVFKGVAGIILKPRVRIDMDRMTLFTAGEGRQFANEYEDKGHRLFSYHLTKGLLEGKNNLRKLGVYLQKNVSRDSRKLGPTYLQEPQIYGSLNHAL